MSVNDPLFQYSAEMGFTHRELRRGLASAVSPYEINEKTPLRFLFENGEAFVEMVIEPEYKRVIASFSLPVTRVTLNFFNMDEPEYERFLGRFRRYLQKGGG